MLAKAASISPVVLAVKTSICHPIVEAVACAYAVTDAAVRGTSGLTSTAKRAAARHSSGFRIFGADIFPSAPITCRWAPIGYGRRPRRRKDAFILDRECELQVLAPIVGVAVGDGRNRIRRKAKIFFCTSFQAFFRGFVRS